MTSPVSRMFGRIAGVYDLLNHILSLGIDRGWRQELAALTSDSDDKAVTAALCRKPMLDLAAGTLDVALALAKKHPEKTILALDFCRPMLVRGLGKLNTPDLQREILPVCADAMQLPLADNSVCCVTMAFGIRNISPRENAFREINRVLAPGGRICLLEFGSAQEPIWGGLYNFYLMRILPAIGRVIARDKEAYSYLARTIGAFPKAAVLLRELEEAGFVKAQFRRLTGGIVCLHWAQKSV